MTRDPKVFKIRAGSGYRNYSGKLVPVQSITLHKDYVVSNSDRSNDISLLKLFQSLLYSNRIKAIAIIDPNTDVKDDTEVTVSGLKTLFCGIRFALNILNVKDGATLHIQAKL